MDYARPAITRLSARLVDAEEEQRFRSFDLIDRRPNMLLMLSMILVAALLSFLYTAAISDGGLSAGWLMVWVGLLAVGGVLVWALSRVESPRQLRILLNAATVTLTVLVATLIYTGWEMGFRGALLILGGVVAVYMAAPFCLVGVIVAAFAYSAVTTSVWLLTTDATSEADVPYTLLLTGLVHALGIADSYRAQVARRVLFAQRNESTLLATIDPLTGLANRRTFGAHARAAWKELADGTASVGMLMVDIDFFKLYNDAYGHPAGDVALQRVAAVIGREMADLPNALASRYGGEEFACLLPTVSDAALAQLAERVRLAVRAEGIAAPKPEGSAATVLTVSVGAAVVDPAAFDLRVLVQAADAALYQAKAAGRDQVQVAAQSLYGAAADTVLP